MKNFKRIASTVMAFALVLSCLAGCGSNSSASEWKKDSESGLTELLIGGIGPLSGDYANYGTSVKKGSQLAVEEINKAGGVNGFKFVLDFQDSQGDPDSAVSAYGKLMDNGMKISLGAVFSGECASVVAAAKEDDIMLLTPSASAKDCIDGNDKAFRVCFNDPAQGTASADFIADNKLATKVAVFYQSDIDYSAGLYETFEKECKVKNIEIVNVQTFTDSTKTDFSTQINAIKSSGAEIVFIPIYAAEASTFLTQAQGKLENLIYFGCDGLDGILTKISNPAQAENVMMLTPFAADDTDETVQNFVKAYKAANNEIPDQFAADGYDAIYAIAEALKKADITSDKTDDFTKNLIAVMTDVSVDGVTGKMSWTADGETTKAAKAMIIKNGVAQVYKK